MPTPGKLPLSGDRNVYYDETVAFIGFDFTGATFRMQIRGAPDAPGAAIVGLSSGSGLTLDYAGTDTVANHIAADRLTAEQVPDGYSDTDNLTLSLLQIEITKAVMALSAAPAEEEGDSVDLAYDILITPSGGHEEKYLYGPFTVRGTVTQ